MEFVQRQHRQLICLVGVLVAFTLEPVHAGGLTGFNWIGSEMSGSMGNTSGEIEYSVDSNLNGISGVSLARWQAAIRSSLDQWANWTRLNFAEFGLFSENDIRFLGADLGTSTLGRATPLVGGTCGGLWANPLNDVCVIFNTNAAISWSDNGTAGTSDIGAVTLHEIGHVLGLAHTNQPAEGYNNHNSVPVPNPATDHYFTWADPTADNVPVMAQSVHYQTNGLLLTDDDIAMARWIYGSSRSPSLINATWGSIDGNAPWIMQTLPAHGPSNGGLWVYSGTIESPAPDSIPRVELGAGTLNGVTEVIDNMGGWSCNIDSEATVCTGPTGLKGNFRLSLRSDRREGIMDWRIGGLEDFTGKTFGPVAEIPEPTTLALLGLAMLIHFRRRPRAKQSER